MTNNTVAAALILPADFTRQYFVGEGRITFELIKNPAQQYHPAIVEEAVGVVTSLLNVVARNFRSDLAEWRALTTGDGPRNYREVGDLVARTGEKIEQVWTRLDPIPVVYERETKEEPADGGNGKPAGFSLFAYLLPGLTAMFLLFLADVAMRDLHREVRFRTFDRLSTLPTSVVTFVGSKVVFTFAILAIGGGILLGGGSLLFGFRWKEPVALMALAAGLCVFSGGLMAALNAWVGGEKRADVINTMVGMGLGMAGGCAFPAESLPAFLRNHVTPWLPPNWFLEAVRGTQIEGYPAGEWPGLTLRMLGLGLVLTVLAAWRLQRNLGKGARA